MVWGRASTPIRDAILVAVSTAAIVIANWPADSPRRLITLRHPAGAATPPRAVGFRTRSLPLDDPRLQRLRQRVERRSIPRPGVSLAVARWRLELAEFYAANPPRYPASDPGERIAWDRYASATRETLERLDRETEARIEAAGPGPIRFGAILPPTTPREALPVAVSAAAIAFLAATFWGLRFPRLSLGAAPEAAGETQPVPRRSRLPQPSSCPPPSSSPQPTRSNRFAGEADRTLALAIPRAWIRVRQPLGVQLRRLCFVAIVAAALASSFLADRLQLSLGI